MTEAAQAALEEINDLLGQLKQCDNDVHSVRCFVETPRFLPAIGGPNRLTSRKEKRTALARLQTTCDPPTVFKPPLLLCSGETVECSIAGQLQRCSDAEVRNALVRASSGCDGKVSALQLKDALSRLLVTISDAELQAFWASYDRTHKGKLPLAAILKRITGNLRPAACSRLSTSADENGDYNWQDVGSALAGGRISAARRAPVAPKPPAGPRPPTGARPPPGARPPTQSALAPWGRPRSCRQVNKPAEPATARENNWKPVAPYHVSRPNTARATGAVSGLRIEKPASAGYQQVAASSEDIVKTLRAVLAPVRQQLQEKFLKIDKSQTGMIPAYRFFELIDHYKSALSKQQQRSVLSSYGDSTGCRVCYRDLLLALFS